MYANNMWKCITHNVIHEINAQKEKQSGITIKGALLRDVKQRPTANQVNTHFKCK